MTYTDIYINLSPQRHSVMLGDAVFLLPSYGNRQPRFALNRFFSIRWSSGNHFDEYQGLTIETVYDRDR